jgi:TRAP-type C4-dicarboxylate transport system permease small subunit
MYLYDSIKKISRRAVPVLDRVMDLLAGAAGILLILIMLLVTYLVLMRYLLGQPPGWVVEICQYMIFALTFLGAPWLLKKGGHVAVDIVLAGLNQRANSTSTVGMLTSFFLAWYGAGSTWQHFTEGIPVIEILRIPKALLLAFIPISFLLLALEFLRQAYDHHERLKKFRRETMIEQKSEKGGG